MCGLHDIVKSTTYVEHISAQSEPNLEVFDPLQPSTVLETADTEDHEYEHNAEDTHDVNTLTSDADQKQFEGDYAAKQKYEKNCTKCMNNENRCLEMQEQMDAMSKKIIKLEKMLELSTDNEEEEYIWMLLK